MKLFHKLIFWSHLLAGLIGGLVIFIMSATGVILMYEHQMVEYAERDVREVAPPSADARRLSLDEIVAKAREQNPKARPTGVVLRNEPTASVAVGFGREGATYINPYSGAVLGQGSKLHDWLLCGCQVAEHTNAVFPYDSFTFPTKERLAAIRGTAHGRHTYLKCAPL